MITEKTQSILLIKCAKIATTEFIKWLEKKAKEHNISVRTEVSPNWFVSNKITITSVGSDVDIDILEKFIENKLMTY